MSAVLKMPTALPAQVAATPIDRARVRQLLQLCHPDKHGGSRLAENVTAWLNDLRRGMPA